MLRAMLPSSATTDGRRPDDRCPGTLRLHPAADGHVARVRVPGGRLRPPQLEVIVGAATELGDASLHLTSRGNVQLRGLDGGSGQELADRLFAVGMLPSPAHDRVRNVVASPWAGLDGRGLVDIETVVADLDALVCSAPDLTGLSGRFLFAVDDGRGDVLALGPDLAVVGQPPGDLRLWVGDRPTTRTASPAGAAGLLVEAARSFLGVRAATSPDAWRVADLGAAADRVAPLDDASTAVAVDTSVTVDTSAATAFGLLGPHRGTWAVTVGLPLGRADATTWQEIVALASASVLGPGVAPIRVTPWRTVVVGGLDGASAHDALARFRRAGLLTDRTSPLAGVSACVGRPGCASATSDVHVDAPHLAGRHHQRPLHVSGCERRCGHPGGARAEAVASGEGRYVVRTHAPDDSVVTTHHEGAEPV